MPLHLGHRGDHDAPLHFTLSHCTCPIVQSQAYDGCSRIGKTRHPWPRNSHEAVGVFFRGAGLPGGLDTVGQCRPCVPWLFNLSCRRRTNSSARIDSCSLWITENPSSSAWNADGHGAQQVRGHGNGRARPVAESGEPARATNSAGGRSRKEGCRSVTSRRPSTRPSVAHAKYAIIDGLRRIS